MADIDTSGGYVNLMANELYENATTSRYAGRVWTDKSVFTDGNVSMDEKGFTNDSDFLVAGSFLGSTRSIVGNESQPIDLMVILDRSSSMAIDYSTDSEPMNDRMHHAVGALNQLFNQVKAHNENSRISLVAYSTETVTSVPLNTCTWEGNLLTLDSHSHFSKQI